VEVDFTSNYFHVEFSQVKVQTAQLFSSAFSRIRSMAQDDGSRLNNDRQQNDKLNICQTLTHPLLTTSIAAKCDGTLHIVNIYRPPDTSMSSFLRDFSDLLARLGNDLEND